MVFPAVGSAFGLNAIASEFAGAAVDGQDARDGDRSEEFGGIELFNQELRRKFV